MSTVNNDDSRNTSRYYIIVIPWKCLHLFEKKIIKLNDEIMYICNGRNVKRYDKFYTTETKSRGESMYVCVCVVCVCEGRKFQATSIEQATTITRSNRDNRHGDSQLESRHRSEPANDRTQAELNIH